MSDNAYVSDSVPSDVLLGHDFKTPFPVIQVTEEMDASEVRYVEMLNYQSGCLTEMRKAVAEMYEVFAALKPLVTSMPKMPPGMMLPGMPRR